jgi:serine/threonine protein kinase
VLRILRGIAAVCAHLHSKNIMHGDLYCHNVLVDPSHSPVLSDFGAASFYAAAAVCRESEGSVAGDHENKQSGLSSSSSSTAVQADLERIESRAFGCLAEDLLQYIELADSEADASLRQRLVAMVQRCMAQVVRERPLFVDLLAELESDVENSS